MQNLNNGSHRKRKTEGEEIKEEKATLFSRTEGFSRVNKSISGHLNGRKQTHTKANQKFQNDKKEKRLPVSQEKTKKDFIYRIENKLKMGKLRERITHLP